jgi:hypothetical protein
MKATDEGVHTRRRAIGGGLKRMQLKRISQKALGRPLLLHQLNSRWLLLRLEINEHSHEKPTCKTRKRY